MNLINKKLLTISFVALASAMSSGYGMNTTKEQKERSITKALFYIESSIEAPSKLNSLFKQIKNPISNDYNTLDIDILQKEDLLEAWKEYPKEIQEWIEHATIRIDYSTGEKIFTKEKAETILKWFEDPNKK